MKLTRVFILTLFLVALFVAPAPAQEAKKIASVNVAKVFDNYKKTKNAYSKLKSDGEKKSKEREKKIDAINKLRDEAAILSKDARDEKEKEYNKKMRELQDFDRDARLELKRKSDDIMKDIDREVGAVIERYGREKGYNIILDDRVILYAQDRVDISADVINELNKN